MSSGNNSELTRRLLDDGERDAPAPAPVPAQNPLGPNDEDLENTRRQAAERQTIRMRRYQDFSPFHGAAVAAVRAIQGVKASCGKKTTDAAAFTVVAVPTVLAYVLNNMNDSGLPQGLKWTGGLDGAYVNAIFSGMGVPKILGDGFKATRDFVKYRFDSTYMNPLQFAVMAALFPVLMYGSYTISLGYNLGVKAGLEGLKKDGWDISDGFHNLMMYFVAQPQVMFNAVLTMPSMLAGARWATDRLFVSREDLALQHYVQGLRAKADRIERTENLQELTDLLTILSPLISSTFVGQRTILKTEANKRPEQAEVRSRGNMRAALNAAVTGVVVVSSVGMYLASVGGLAATVQDEESMPRPSRELTRGLRFLGMDHFGPALIGNLPNLAFAIFYGLPGVACLIDMFSRVRNNLDGGSVAKIVGYVSYAITLGVILFSGVTSFAQGYNGGSALPAAIRFAGEVLLLCSLSFLAAFVSNLGGAFQYMHTLHQQGLLSLVSSCTKEPNSPSSGPAAPLLADQGASEGKAEDLEAQEVGTDTRPLTRREEFETKLSLVKAVIAMLEAAAAGSGTAAEKTHASLLKDEVATVYFHSRQKFLLSLKEEMTQDPCRASFVGQFEAAESPQV